MKKWKIYVVPHTHWDREWYFTKATANTFLYFNFKKIFEEYKQKQANFPKFVYDSQYSVVDEYLKIAPKDESKIKDMVKNNKLVISPWYTQTDTFNVTGESILRNMLTGIKESQKYGNYMRVAYMPDSFGFNSNLPQIFNKFGMKSFIHWRGVKKEHLEEGVLNKWVGIDGTEIVEYNLFKYGYTCGGRFTYDLFRDGYEKENIKENAKKIFESIKNDKAMNLLQELKNASKNTNNKVLFPWGSDQMVCFENLGELISEINKLDDENEWILTSYEEFTDEILKDIENIKTKQLSGELRYGEYSRVHKTINSSRYDIKYLTKNLEYLIYKIAEPLSLIYEKSGGKYPNDLLQLSQRILFECQAHDSVGGCNSDKTNRSIIERLNVATDNINSLITFIQRQISFANKCNDNDLLIFNLEPLVRNLKYTMTIFTRKKSFKILDEKNNEIKYKVVSKDYVDANEFKINKNIQNTSITENKNKESFYWHKIILEFKNVEPVSIKTFKIIEDDFEIKSIINKNNFIENNFYMLKVENNEIILKDKKRNITFKNAIILESNKDVGDLYDYSPETYDEVITSKLKKIQLLSCDDNLIPSLEANFHYQIEQNNNKTEQIFNIKFYLFENKIDLDIDTKNTAEDIRWRILFNTNIDSNESYSDTSFGKIKRNKNCYENELKIWKNDKWNDYPVDIEALESCCWKKSNDYTYSVFSKCNNEYQLSNLDNKKLAITLFRAVSYIGRNNLLYRPERASGNSVFPLETPDGNLKGKNLNIKFRFGISDNDNNVVVESKDWCIDNTYYQVQKINLFEKNGDMFVLPTMKIKKYDNDLLKTNIDSSLVVSCLKKSYDLQKNIIRIYNPTNNKINIKDINLKEINVLEDKKLENSEFIEPNEFKVYEF
ncbi:glycoside hydrolase family 38 C-terminal domain-containing protein [Spiroplasma endosymbiont of Crioceris asparagi]|uniref:glycoside hydrolase family 38 N-terminal domain-containing protein n=1 Tax=Spiroplasma endosymbiont of Crioceris asparagi TaxID=3066286 RepID=UPI0030D49675